MVTENNSSRQRERGVALLMTMLAMMLLSVIALGMMVSTNTETSITSNFRDKQAATFAAMAGLQEARDRIQPVTNSIPAPTDVPSLSAANVIYLINPRSGETIWPWDMSANNPYKDTELCQEHMQSLLGITLGTPGVPCSGATNPMPTGTLWRQVIDNSQTTSAPWNLPTPLDVKWTRISLKTNNMTPIAVNGVSSSGAIVCWDGSHQIPLPAGYGPDCAPNGGIATVKLVTAGTGYMSTPTVTIDPPPAGGIQATATAAGSSGVDLSQVVVSTTLTGGGSGYTTAPTVTLSGGGGSGATATASIVAWTGSPLASISMTSPGSGCYSDPTQAPVIISGGGGTGATAVSVLASSTSCILSWSVSGNLTASGPCKAALKNTTATLTATGGGGSGFSGTVSFDNSGKVIGTPTIVTRGTGYTSAPLLDAYMGSDCSLTYTILPGKLVASLSLTSAGDGYTSVPTVTISSGATAGSGTATLASPSGNQGQVTALNLITGGSGYTSAPTVSFSGGGGTGATGTTALGTVLGNLTCCTITNPGKGYVDDPVVHFSGGGGGTGATAKATVGRGLNYGKVYVLTSLASTTSGSRTMMQMEVTTPVSGWASLGALTIDGPLIPSGTNKTLNFPNSQPFVVSGADANSCGETAEPLHPAIAAYDNPNSPTAISSVDQIEAAIPRPDHYTGAGGTPSVVDNYGILGDTMGTPIGLSSLIAGVHQKAATAGNIYGNDPSIGSLNLGSAAAPAVNYVNGDLTLNGNHDGYGVLVVTGSLHFGGNFTWHGVVLVVGDGNMEFNGGGNGQIIGTALVAKIWDNSHALLPTMGSPTFTWQGGGGNGVLYDHCWATDLMNQIPFTPPPSTAQLRVLSLRQLPY